ncbi:MAG TPA: transketolase C-terminal domain-containing protein [Sphaerochaeta sp.]|nr:transketolase C-terminal domain-containing protein [Sphaerochaeta sp.]
MDEYRSCREAFTEALRELATLDKEIVVLSSDARGSCSLNEFVDHLPEQFVEVGIAEQNLVGIAAGLAAVGKKPYVCAPACFIATRSLEQIKVDVAYSGKNVTILGVSGGISYGALGASHHTLHDIAALRAIPGIMVLLPSDAVQTQAILKAVSTTDQPVYIRIGRNKIPPIYSQRQDIEPFVFGKATLLQDGEDITLVACGELVYHALQAAEQLTQKGVSARVLDMASLKPFDVDAIVAAATETKAIVTVEEHSINGGLGATVSQIVCRHKPVPVRTLGLPDQFLITGTSLELFAHYGLDATGIASEALDLLASLE